MDTRSGTPAAGSATAISVRQLTKTFSEGDIAVHAVSGIDLDIAAGEVVLVMGPSGSGKTTLLLMLGAMLRPTSGSVVIDGVDLATAPERRLPALRARHLGFIFQDFNLLSALTALENVELACNLAGTTGHAARDRATVTRRELGGERKREGDVRLWRDRRAGRDKGSRIRAWVVRRPGPFAGGPLAFIERPAPVPGPGEVRARVSGCRVWRTDLHLAEGDRAPHGEDVIPGHEVVGVVDQVGPGASRFSVGERVGIAWLRRTCGSCRFCVRSDENLCLEPRFTGWDADGGYAEYAVVDERFAYRLPGGSPTKR